MLRRLLTLSLLAVALGACGVQSPLGPDVSAAPQASLVRPEGVGTSPGPRHP